jgi:2-aminoethylphosphonate aminotransferase
MESEKLTKVIPRKILLNPGPATTSQAVKLSQIVADICPREQEFGDLLDDIRQGCVDVVNGKNNYEAILLGGSGTGAMEACLTSCTNEGEEIVIINNGAYGKRMTQICEAFETPFSTIDITWGDPVDLDKVRQHLQSRKAKALAFIHHETTVGILNPIKELKKLADEFNMITILDAMSSYAGIELNVEEVPIDFIISSSNKCIQGMAGIGIVIAKTSELTKLQHYKTKSFYFNLYNNFLNQKEKKQFLFTPPVQTVYALKAAIDEFRSEGIERRAKRYSDLYEQMYEGMLKLGFKPLIEKSRHAKILTAFIEPSDPNYHFDKMHDFLYERGITIYPGKGAKEDTFRISNIGTLGKEDISYFLKNIEKYLKVNKLSL